MDFSELRRVSFMEKSKICWKNVLRLGRWPTLANAWKFCAFQEKDIREQKIIGLHLIFVNNLSFFNILNFLQKKNMGNKKNKILLTLMNVKSLKIYFF